MVHLSVVLMFVLAAASAAAATHSVTYTACTGGTYYAFPVGQSLDDWTTYRVQLSESAAPNAGKYSGTLDDAQGSVWFLFSGASQPASWSSSVASAALVGKADTIKVEGGDATDAINAQADQALADYDGPTKAELDAGLDALPTAGEIVAAVYAAARASYDAAGSMGEAINLIVGKLPGGSIAGANDVGTTQPRVNFEPDPGFTLVVPDTAGSISRVAKIVSLPPGLVGDQVIALDMSRLYGKRNVKDVGAPTVTGDGNLTAEAVGPRDCYAYVGIEGTIEAGETYTVRVPVTMEHNAQRTVEFRVRVNAE